MTTSPSVWCVGGGEPPVNTTMIFGPCHECGRWVRARAERIEPHMVPDETIRSPE